MADIIVRERMYIPSYLVDERDVKKRYVHRFYEESACRKCDNRSERHNYVCQKCPAYTGKNVTVNEKIVDGVHYYGIPLGERKNLKAHLGIKPKRHTFIDLRTKAKRRYDVRMVNFKPFDYQEPAVEKLGDAGFGILKAPPRSGKTPTMLYTGIKKFPYRICIIADQKEFLDQFLAHVEEFTNLPQLEKKYKKKLYGYGKKPEDFKNFEIIVCTYQTFLSEKGKKLLKLLNKNYGTVFVDEVHSSGALKYSEVLNELWMRVRIGATGTVERKDCVVADTPVLTEHGACAIQDIRVGDRVYSKSAAGDLELREVVEIHVRQNSPTVKVAYDGGIIQCTPDHEFWTTRGYVKAKDLTPEDELIEFSPDLE